MPGKQENKSKNDYFSSPDSSIFHPQNCIMTGELRIIFRIIQSAVQERPIPASGPKHVSFSIKFHQMPLACMWFPSLPFRRNHQTVARMHTVPLYQPWHIGSIKQRRNIIFYLPGCTLGFSVTVYLQRKNWWYTFFFLFSHFPNRFKHFNKAVKLFPVLSSRLPVHSVSYG